MDLFQSDSTLQFAGFLSYPAISIHEHAMTFLTGKSGSGKSTSLRLLNATLRPSRGSIVYRGRPLDQWPPLAYRREVMLVPQRDFLYDATVRENFARFHEMRESPVPDDSRIRSALALGASDCTPDTPCSTLSGGERQRVFLALFLSCETPVLLLDEPTSALDDETSRRFLSGLDRYRKEKGVTVVCVCHRPELALEFGDERISLEDRP